MISLFDFALALLQAVLLAAKQKEAASLVAALEAGLAQLKKVRSTEVTRSQLESLRG